MIPRQLMSSPKSIVFGVFLAYMTSIAYLSFKGGDITSLFFISRDVAENSEVDFARKIKVLDEGGYDGQYYLIHSYGLLEPSKVMPSPYRSRPLLPLIVSFFGLPKYNPELFVMINSICLLASLFLLSRFYQNYLSHEQQLWAHSFLLNLGMLTSFRFQLTETLALVLFLLVCFLCLKKKESLGTYLLISLVAALALLARDAFVFALAGLGVFSLIMRRWALSGSLIISLFPILWIRHLFITGDDKLPLINLFSIYDYAIKRVSFDSLYFAVSSNLFWVMIIFLSFATYSIARNLNREDKPQWLFGLCCLFSIIFLGFFNPTSAWGNISGVARHLAVLFPLLPLCCRSKDIKALSVLNLFLSAIFVYWVIAYRYQWSEFP